MSAPAESTPTYRIDGPADEGGPTVVLLNGVAMSMPSWEPLVPFLAPRVRVLRLDFRGQLLSPGTAHADFKANADDVAALLDRLGLVGARRPHILGTSFGGGVALDLAARHPEVVATLTVVASAPQVDAVMHEASVAWRDACREALAGGSRTRLFDLLVPAAYTPEFVAANAALLDQRRMQFALFPDVWFSGLEGLMDAVLAADNTSSLAAIDTPTLVVDGGRDLLIAPEVGAALAAAIPGAEHVTFAEAGHGLVFEHPERLAALWFDFVGRRAPAA